MDRAATPQVSRVGFLLRALSHRNYRLFFFGNGLSLIGTWMTWVATRWLVYRLAGASGSQRAATILGFVSFAGQLPLFVLAPFAGVIVDRLNRHRVLLATQFLSMLESAALAVLALLHVITIPQVLMLNVFQGLVNAFDIPARQSFVAEIVERRDDLPNAIALNSSMFNVARLIGPAIGGVLLARFGEGACFSVDAVSYFAVLLALLAMTVRPVRARESHTGALTDLRDGFRYALGFAPVRTILLLVGAMSFTSSAFQVLLPVFAAQSKLVFFRNPSGMFGAMVAAMGVGALGGALYLASRRSVLGLGRVLARAAALLGLAMIGFGFSRAIWLTLPLATIGGFGLIVNMASGNTLLQSIVDDEMRGRLMSFFSMSVMGMAPFGSLIAGWASDRIGPGRTVIVGGFITIICAGLFTTKIPEMRKLIRPIYVRKGIIPEVAEGLQNASTLLRSERR